MKEAIMAQQYDELVFLVEEHRRALLADAVLARHGAVADRARPAPAGPRLRAARLVAAVAVGLLRAGAPAARPRNLYGIANEESRDDPYVLVRRGPLRPWPELCPERRRFG